MKLWRRIRTIALIGVLMLASLGLAGCFTPGREGALVLPSAKVSPPNIISAGVLRVGVDSTRAPFSGRAGDSIIGIDVDIAAALAEQMGLKLEIISTDGQDMAALLADGTIDVAMGIQASETTPFAEAQVGPYLIDGPAAFSVGLSNAPQEFDPAQLNGMRIVAQEGSLSAWQVAKDYGEDNLSTYPSLSGVFGELSSGSVSYAVVDAIVGSFLAIQYENIRCEGILKEPQGVYIGVASENQTLKDQVGNALIELRDGGKLRVIVAKWIGPVSAQAVLSTQGIISLSGTGETEVPADSTQTPPSTN